MAVKAARRYESPRRAEQAQQTSADVKTDASKTEAAKPEGSKHHASGQARKSHVRGYEADEAKARRIAARYGVYW